MLKTQPDREIGSASERGERPAGKVSSSRMTPPAAGNGRIQRERRADRPFFTVRDLIACRFHYLCTNVTFSSDQGAQQPPPGNSAQSLQPIRAARADRGEEVEGRYTVRPRY